MRDDERTMLEKILANVEETNALVHELKLWRKFILWAFSLTTGAAGLFEFVQRILSWRTK